MFEAELDFFIAHQDELVAAHADKVLVIRGQEVVDVFSSPLEALAAARARFEPGTFMIQPCQPGTTAYTVTLASSEVLAASPPL
jgi:hypothetical protein